MIFIAHRGNLYGPNSQKENHPDYIDESISQNFVVEIDVRLIKNKIYLGHDNPQYEIPLSYLLSRRDFLVIHAKNTDILPILLENDLHCFFHDTDECTLTSRNFIWVYPGKNHPRNSIAVMPEITSNKILNKENIIGICSDYIYEWRELM